jgi:WD40 repeat protein/DNA-binding SARP family transcriptional activator
MEFRILGPLEVRSELGAIELGGTKPRAVLAVLLLHANEPVSAERLAMAVWGEEASAGTPKNVQVNVSRLRRVLGDDVLETTPAGYRLRVRPGELDVQRFEQRVEQGRRALAAGRAQEAATFLREAEGMWRGPPLADLANLPFAAAEIARLEEQQLAVIEARVEAEASAGLHAELVGELRRLVAEHPTREGLAAQLMLALYRSGRQAEALDAYRDARRRLAEEIGVEPGPELRAVQDAILHHDPSLELYRPAIELPHELAAAATSPLIGRVAELRWLLEQWERASVTGALVTVVGVPGIGKTRLAAELAEEVHRRGASVLYASGRGPASAALEVLDRARAAEHPTLAIVDDVDKAEAVVPVALRELADAPVLLLATGEDADALGLLQATGALTLEAVDRETVRAIAAGYASNHDVDDATAEWLVGASGGVPRRVHDAARHWARREAARRVMAVAGRAAAGRAELRSMEDELAGGVHQLQTVRDHVEGRDGDDGPVICPFKGLASFQPADAAYFFGRERLIAELVARLVGAPLLGVVGPSGSGKSSVVRAGLLPALANGVLPGSEDWPRVLIRPGEHPSQELDRVTADRDPSQRAVLAVDQFEETFTACRDEEERSRFIAKLVRVARGDGDGSVVVLAIRADFYGRCAAYAELSRLLAANHLLVGAMRRTELRRVITGPAERVGLHVEPDLVEALVSDVEDEPGALPLLSSALLELWQRRDGRHLGLALHEQTGGVLGAVARLAEGAFGRLDERQQPLARSVLLRLAEVEPEGGVERRRLPLEELERDGGPDVAAVIGLLADARLLTVSAGAVEFAHEALLREWPRLREWIEDDRDDLRVHRNLSSATQEWIRLGRDDGALYRGARLAEARDWAERGDPGPTDAEREFLDASGARVERDRKARRRRIEIAFAGLIVALAAITAVAIVALYQRREAGYQRDIAASRELAARAASFLDADPGLSLALALQALERRDTEQAENVLRQATLASRAVSAWPAHDGAVHAVEPSGDGRRVATAGRDGAVRIWDLQRGRPVWSVQAHEGWALGVSLSADGGRVATAGDDGVVAIWDVRTKRRRVLARLAPDYATGVELSPDGRTVIVPVIDGTVRVVPVSGHGPVMVLRGHQGPVWSAHFSPDGKTAVSTGDDRSARIWDLASGQATVLHHPESVAGAAFSPNGGRVATAAADGVVRIWDASGRGRPLTIVTDEQEANSVRFSGDGLRLVTAGEDGVVRLWDARGGPALAELKGHRGVVLAAAFVPATDTIVSGGEDGMLRRWAPADTAMVQAPVIGASFSPDGRRVVSGGEDGVVRVWNPASGSVTPLPGHQAPSFARFSADGQRIASASFDGTVRLWDVRNGRSKVIFAGDPPLFSASFDPDGRRVAIAGGLPRIVLQPLDGGSRVVLSGHQGVVRDATFSPDGKHVASASDDGTVRLWNAASGKLERTLRGHGQSVSSVSYSPDGRRVVSAGADGTVRIWDVNGEGAVILRGHEGPVSSAEFNPAGDRVTSAGEDGTIRVWSARGGETLVVLHRYDGPATAAGFSADGRRVVSAGDPGLLRVSPCEECGPLSSVLRLARTRAARELSPTERQRLLPGGR